MSVHEISDQFVDDYAAAEPVLATYLGVVGYDDQLTDYSPEGHAARAAIQRRALNEMEGANPTDDSERVAKAVFLERISNEYAIHDAGLDIASLNTIASPVQELREVFDMMPTDTPEQWETIATRMSRVPAALDGVRASLLAAAEAGRVSALRQVTKVAEQADYWAGMSGRTGYFEQLAAGADRTEGVSDSLKEKLRNAARQAQEAYAELAGFLRAELAPKAPSKDAVGEEDYRLWSRYFLGADLDPREAYEWGWEEFFRVEREAKEVANRIKSGATLAEAAAALDADDRYKIRGQKQFEEWMQNLSDEALSALSGTHFEISDRIRALECKIAPPGGHVGAYYTAPSEDFSRPGRMWWSVPADKEEFSTWREVTTVYHEGAPGHHLQIATAVQEQSLNRFQRLLASTSGHAEGWALYAERLMRELGFLEDDGNLLGMLDAHLFRAARVIVDIGMHLELEIPAGTGFHEGERWTPELGLEFMLTRTITDPDHVHDEIDRYLGWPGQAPAYKLGERLWLQAREDARRRQGESFDLKDFHTKALRLGGMGLATLKEQLAALD
ncbi:DUF885 domain-containing protein [Saccharomonospora viridis]|jgi:uncharacterized protein (DUF885 family)|uniref:Uncharacterized conserved protein n=2 Tax=Saccharomonospora viridis TaxID=1852 RepID=C7MVE4_SACVD|nr:DUF885 domain-containing protein [Saccharomonospora viridis]ACU97773.1 uncharacterized conserved protein [Saccharomonospora viridis DSM 43017]KHF45731.1 hypothetical protein MINT15_00320 [Saccharomonospora viridis]SFP44065.1 Uncharacterized conserved protein, DUF885 familyt [Saccharomonospora viridis]